MALILMVYEMSNSFQTLKMVWHGSDTVQMTVSL